MQATQSLQSILKRFLFLQGRSFVLNYLEIFKIIMYMKTSFSQQIIDTYQLDRAVLPLPYLKFLDNIETYSGKSTHGFFGFSVEDPLEINFMNPWLLKVQRVFDDWDIEREEHPTLIPLLQIDPQEANFLLTDIGKAECPVVMWEHETGEFDEVFPSLDTFLSGLQ